LFLSTASIDIIDEAINYFRANVLFRKFEVKSSSDKLLIYLTLYINMCLKRIEGCRTEADGIKAIISLGLERFPIPGEAGFPLGGLLTPPKSREEAGRTFSTTFGPASFLCYLSC
jgi:actin related protein 2/3 complex subunit 3